MGYSGCCSTASEAISYTTTSRSQPVSAYTHPVSSKWQDVGIRNRRLLVQVQLLEYSAFTTRDLDPHNQISETIP